MKYTNLKIIKPLSRVVAMCLTIAAVMVCCTQQADAPTECYAKLEEAQELAQQGKLSQALAIYKEVAATGCSQVDKDNASCVATAMVQAFNMWQMMEQPRAAVEWLDSLRLVKDTGICEADLHALLAYALTRIDSVSRAEEMADYAINNVPEKLSALRKMRIYTYAMGALSVNPQRDEQAMLCGKQALEWAKEVENPQGVQYTRSTLAQIYQRRGEVSKAIDLLNASLEEAKSANDANGTANALNSIAQAYERWNMNGAAEKYVDLALQQLGNTSVVHPVIAAESLTLKAKLLMDKKDRAAIAYLRRADSLCSQMAYNMGQEDVDLLMALYHLQLADSVAVAEKRLLRIASKAVDMKKPEAYYHLAKIYHDRSDAVKTEEMLDSMRTLMQRLPDVQFPSSFSLWGVRYYAGTHNADKVLRFSELLTASHKEEDLENMQRILVENLVAFSDRQHEEEIEVMRLEEQAKWYRWLLAGAAVLLLLVVGGMWAWISRLKLKGERNQLMAEKTELEHGLATEKETHEHSKMHYAQMLDDLSRQQLADEITIENIQNKGEEWLNRHFMASYPHFDQVLAEKGVKLGKREKLLAMLLIFGFENHNIAKILGIAKQSVTISRYRIRQKFGISAEMNLEAYLRNLANRKPNNPEQNDDVKINGSLYPGMTHS